MTIQNKLRDHVDSAAAHKASWMVMTLLLQIYHTAETA